MSTLRQECLVMRAGKSHLRLVVVSHQGIFVCLFQQNRFQYPPCPIMKMSINGTSTITGHASWEITPPIGCCQSYWNVWLLSSAKQIAIPSVPHHDNERQQSVNDCSSGIMGNLVGDRLHIVKN
jgi:hypothetical protein